MTIRNSSKRKYWMFAAGLFAAATLALMTYPFQVDVHRFPELESRASIALGRKVRLSSLKLSMLSSKLVANDIEIDDDPAFSRSAFLTAKSVQIDVELWPLIFSRQLNVTGITVEHPEITLLEADDGTYNFSSLGGASRKNQGRLIARPRVSVPKFQVTAGKLTVGRLDSSRLYRIYDDFNIEVANFSLTSPFLFKLTTKLPGGGSAVLSGHAGPISVVDASGTPFEAALKATDVNISAYGFIDPAIGIRGTATLEEDVISDGNRAFLTGTFSASGITLSPTGSPSSRTLSIDHRLDLDLDQHSVTVTQGDISIGDALLHMSGVIQKHDEARLVNLQVSGSGLPVDEMQLLLPAIGVKLPVGSHLQGGTVSMQLAVKGTLGSPLLSSRIQIVDAKLVGFNLGAHLGSLSGFAGETVSAPDTFIHGLVLQLKTTRAGRRADHVHAEIPSVGEATGAGSIGPDGALDLKMMAIPSGGVAGTLSKMASADSGKGIVPVAIVGTLENPVFVVDASAGVLNMASQTASRVVSAPVQSIRGLLGKKRRD